jgi:hypothetical protein
MIKFILELIQNNINTTVSFLAVFISLLTIRYTRKNIKTSKYIETITQQRIKWIDTLRNDFSEILAQSVVLKFTYDVKEMDELVGQPDNISSPLEQFQYDEFVSDNINELSIREKNNFIIISKIELAILRLNDKDDIELLKILKLLKKLVLSKRYTEIDDGLLDKLRNSIKILLKNEWEKVKKEVTKGGNLIASKKKLSDKYFNI